MCAEVGAQLPLAGGPERLVASCATPLLTPNNLMALARSPGRLSRPASTSPSYPAQVTVTNSGGLAESNQPLLIPRCRDCRDTKTGTFSKVTSLSVLVHSRDLSIEEDKRFSIDWNHPMNLNFTSSKRILQFSLRHMTPFLLLLRCHLLRFPQNVRFQVPHTHV